MQQLGRGRVEKGRGGLRGAGKEKSDRGRVGAEWERSRGMGGVQQPRKGRVGRR